MKKSIISLLLVTGYVLGQDHNELHVTKEKLEKIKASATTWTPYEEHNHPFRGMTNAEVKKRLGLIMHDEHKSLFSSLMNLLPVKKTVKEEKPHIHLSSTLPTSFDVRTQWPSCAHSVRDQGSCGSCWAFASAGMLEDRFCIASGGSINERLSPQDLVDCDFNNGGCNGGFCTSALNYLITDGIVSETCLPYVSGDSGYNGYCKYRCSDLSTSYKKYACKYGSMKLLTDYTDIQQEIYDNGPLMVGFTVYDDFTSYSSGVYTRTSDTVSGGHAVKLIGWGTDGSGNLYWVCQNQWGTSWGISGYFNIYTNQCGLDAVVYACDADV